MKALAEINTALDEIGCWKNEFYKTTSKIITNSHKVTIKH